MEHIFRAYDIRGIYNKDLKTETMVEIGMALGSIMKEKGEEEILVGNDIRTSSSLFSNALIAGLLATGREVTNVGKASFGVALFAGWKLENDISAYITASHLPPEWNGLKLYNGEGEGFSEQQIYEIKNLVLTNSYRLGSWKELKDVKNVDYKNEYINFMAKNLMTQLF